MIFMEVKVYTYKINNRKGKEDHLSLPCEFDEQNFEKYGSVTLEQIENELNQKCTSYGIELICFQSNHEGDLVDKIHQAAKENVDAVIINPGAYTHTSIAIRDAPFIEVHLTNIFAREPFRHHSFLSDIARGCIIGLGYKGYLLAAEYLINSK